MQKQLSFLILFCLFIALVGCGDSNKPKLNTPLPFDWPSDIPIMDGMTVVQVQDSIDTELAGPNYMLTLIGKVSRDEAWDYYSNLDGWEFDPAFFQDDFQPNAEDGMFASEKGNIYFFFMLGSINDEIEGHSQFLNLGFNDGDSMIVLNVHPLD